MYTVPPEAIAEAAGYLYVFGFDEGTRAERREAKQKFNELCAKLHRDAEAAMLQKGFFRPAFDEFRGALINHCRVYLNENGKLS